MSKPTLGYPSRTAAVAALRRQGLCPVLGALLAFVALAAFVRWTAFHPGPALTTAAGAAAAVALSLVVLRRGRWFGIGAAAIVLAVAILPRPAFAAGTTVDFTPIFDLGVEIFAAVLTAAALWVAGRLMRWLKIDGDAKANALLHAAIDRAIAAAAGRARAATSGWSVDVRASVAAEAGAYLAQHLPETLRQLGATPEALRSVITAKLDALADARSEARIAGKDRP